MRSGSTQSPGSRPRPGLWLREREGAWELPLAARWALTARAPRLPQPRGPQRRPGPRLCHRGAPSVKLSSPPGTASLCVFKRCGFFLGAGGFPWRPAPSQLPSWRQDSVTCEINAFLSVCMLMTRFCRCSLNGGFY